MKIISSDKAIFKQLQYNITSNENKTNILLIAE